MLIIIHSPPEVALCDDQQDEVLINLAQQNDYVGVYVSITWQVEAIRTEKSFATRRHQMIQILSTRFWDSNCNFRNLSCL